MKNLSFLAVLSLLALTLPFAIASDPSPLQDFCVAVNTPANGGMYMMMTSESFCCILFTDFISYTLYYLVIFLISVCEWKVLQRPKACHRG